MAQSSPLINKNITKQETHKYLFTSMVSIRGTPLSFAMRADGKIFYSVLNMSNTEQNASTGGNDKNNDKNYWSQVTFNGIGASRLHFPAEVIQVGYGVVPNFQVDKYDSNNRKIIHDFDSDGKPLDENGKELSVKAIKDKTDFFHSSTARLGAKVPFQVLTDGKYVYVFRQSIAKDDPNNESPAIVNNSLLVDRFILSGSVLKLSREIRYQRSRHKTQPESRKDTLAPADVEGIPFYEPTRELAFANKLSNGNFSVLLLPGADSEEQRWQIFTTDPTSNKVNSFNIRFDASIVFDTSNSQAVIDDFLERMELDTTLITAVQNKIVEGKLDEEIATELLADATYIDKNLPTDDLTEIVYTIRTGVVKDDFILESTSEWPLIEYESEGNIKPEYLEKGVLIDEYAFRDDLKPHSAPYKPKGSLSSCYYFQQEMGADGKPMKNKACVMLAMGLQDYSRNKFIGILNFSVAASGQLSRLSTDAINMPDINVQALDENPYRDLDSLRSVAWQQSQKMRILDIDPNGLSTTGGVLKFGYTSAAIGESQGYSDAVVATAPYLFDDSLGRVNLYFKGRNNNFFVLYFNPTGNKSVEVTDANAQPVSSPLSLIPRLDRDLALEVNASVSDFSSSFIIKSRAMEIEKWLYLPRRYSQICEILNGNGELPLGKLVPLGISDDPRLAFIKPMKGYGTLKLRTTVDNNLIFKYNDGYANELADGTVFALPLLALSPYLNRNKIISIAKKTFQLTGTIKLESDTFYKSYLSGIVTDVEDINKLWNYLIAQALIQEVAEQAEQGKLRAAAITGSITTLSVLLEDQAIDNLSLELLKEDNIADKKIKRAKLKQSLISLILDVAKVRFITFEVKSYNTRKVERFEAGLAVSTVYNYEDNFICNTHNLDGISASKWEHNRSYLFNVKIGYDKEITPKTEMDADFLHKYAINNSIGQWEDWEASLAVELNPTSASSGTVFSTSDSDKLEALRPTAKGLSVEAWVKPSNDLNNPASILSYEKDGQSYSLGVQKKDSNGYECVATLGGTKYTSKNTFSFHNAEGNEQWRHLAFTHKKYWGYGLTSENFINCGNDSSLQLEGDFSLEVLVKINTKGTLLKKKGEYSLLINSNNEVVFKWAGTEILLNDAYELDALNQFYKITLIRSNKKPQTEPPKEEYPITGGDQAEESKWYEGKGSDDLLKGMAEKQDQMDQSMKLSGVDMFGSTAAPLADENSKYYYTLIVTKSDNSSEEFTTKDPIEIEKIESYENLILGGDGFVGTFANIRIWNRALSKDEAKVIPLPDNKAGLLSDWRMTEGKGTYLYDNVSENHGVAVGGIWTDSPQTNQAGQFQFYVDGTPEVHGAPIMNAPQGVDQMSIGGQKINDTDFKDHFKGTLEEIRIWNTPRTNEQITDNAFGRLKGEWEQLLANYTFDKPISQTDNKVQDSSVNSVQLTIHNDSMFKEVLSTAPIATEIPQVRSALTGVLTEYNGTILSRPGIVEYGDVQLNEDGTLNGILKRCYSFIDADGIWNRMTGYKVGNLVSQWYGQAQFSPQVMGYIEGPPPVPAENFPVGKNMDVDTFAYHLDNSVSFNQAEKVAYNYTTSKDAGWNVAVESEMRTGGGASILTAPLGFGLSFKMNVGVATDSNWETSGNRSQSFKRGTSVNTERAFSASLTGYDDGTNYYQLGNTGYALVKSKTADIYLLRLVHNNALISITWQPNPDIPEDVNIIPFPLNPYYTKQGILDGKFGDRPDDHYPQAQGAYGEYSYFKPREAYKLKKQIEREKMELKAYFDDSFDVAKTNGHFQAAAATTGVAQIVSAVPVAGTLITSLFNQVAGQLATQVGYNNTELKEDLSKMGSQRNLVNTYVWTVEGGFYSESTEVAENQQETFANESSLSLGGGLGVTYDIEGGATFDQKSLFSSGSSFTLTKSKTKESKSSFGLDVNVAIPTSPRYKYGGIDGRTLTKGLIAPGTVDAYRFMSFYLEPKGENFIDLFSKVIDPIWLDESPDPNAQALREAQGNIDKAKPCWRIMHRVTYVSRILPEFQSDAPPSLEKALRVSGMESNYTLIKRFEPYIAHISDSGTFFAKIEEIIDTKLPEFAGYKPQIKKYLALYFNIDQT